MRCYLPDEEKLRIKIANLPIIKHEKVELDNRLTFEEARHFPSFMIYRRDGI
jgi:hypothetical protein